jgi:hypothetical protein
MNTQRANDQVHARRVLEDTFARQNAMLSCVTFVDEGFNFCREPAQYEWSYIEKREMLVPYNCALSYSGTSQEVKQSPILSNETIRWEMHRVWVVEGVLCRGESNVLQRRRFYIDEDSWLVLLGEGYDRSGEMVMHYLLDSYIVSSKLTGGCWYGI